MIRKHRLTDSKDFKRVRQIGKTYAHPFIVLIVSPSSDQYIRIGIIVSRAVGNAVLRNRAKRKIRAILNPIISEFSEQADIVVIARPKLLEANHQDLKEAIHLLLSKAYLYKIKEYE